jgi:hypothetical protein
MSDDGEGLPPGHRSRHGRRLHGTCGVGPHPRAPAGWRCTAPSHDPGRGLWEAVAIGPKVGGRCGAPPATGIGEGPDELAALRDLAERQAAGA